MDSMCVRCKQYYGGPQTQNLCSLCYKQYKKENNIQEELKILQVKEPQIPKQADHTKCFTCNKKIGLLGFKCNQCDCSYCKLHRLPEDHSCNVDFVEMGKKEIEQKNQNITAPKIQEI